ncbi:MAG TPA: chemotaxis protein CheB [Gammaproteobacteria bacterium]|jgi:two-component system chemotaxis response regulator CheB|nr:chemotaxis protein CheB [Gammaproteobacteria bacterium]
MKNRDIIVIGASAGGLEALKDLLVQLPEDFPAAIFVVMHVGADAPGLLADILNERTPLTAKQTEDEQSIRQGFIYMAPPDRHTLLSERHVRLKAPTARKPFPNGDRPAVPFGRRDSLFARDR